MNKRDKIIYWIATGLFSVMLLMGAIMYFVQYDMVTEMFAALGYPASLIYPLASAKIAGVIALLLIKNPIIKTLAYLGFTVNLALAIIAHVNVGDGEAAGAVAPLVLLIISYIFYRRTSASTQKAGGNS